MFRHSFLRRIADDWPFKFVRLLLTVSSCFSPKHLAGGFAGCGPAVPTVSFRAARAANIRFARWLVLGNHGVPGMVQGPRGIDRARMTASLPGKHRFRHREAAV